MSFVVDERFPFRVANLLGCPNSSRGNLPDKSVPSLSSPFLLFPVPNKAAHRVVRGRDNAALRLIFFLAAIFSRDL